MLRSVDDLNNYTLMARDGEIGRCRDFLFDDAMWAIRYMVADTGKWLPRRKVLISPVSLGDADFAAHHLRVALEKEQIKKSPEISEHEPVSRRQEKEIHDFFGWDPYWTAPVLGRPSAFPPAMLKQARETATAVETKDTDNDSHLRSVQEVKGYHIHARDGKIGHVEDFIVDDETWVIRYVVVDTRNLLPGRKVLIAPKWVDSVNWGGQTMHIDLPKERIKNGPTYDPTAPVNREIEARLYDYYGRPTYWL